MESVVYPFCSRYWLQPVAGLFRAGDRSLRDFFPALFVYFLDLVVFWFASTTVCVSPLVAAAVRSAAVSATTPLEEISTWSPPPFSIGVAYAIEPAWSAFPLFCL